MTVQTIYGLERRIEEMQKRFRVEIRRIKQQFREKNSLNDILITVCDALYFEPEEVKGASRVRPLPDVRKIIAFKARQRGHTFAEIGEFLNRDHSTITVMIQEYKARIKTDQNFIDLVEAVDSNIKSFSLESYGIEDMEIIKNKSNGE